MPRSEHEFFAPMRTDETGWHRLRVRFEMDGNDMLAFMVQYETFMDKVWRPVVRYDTSHGEAHRDIYDPAGEQVGKQWLGVTQPPFNALFTAAYEELRQNWRHYFQTFLNRDRSRG